jgi:PAS domain S-box-containing protein
MHADDRYRRAAAAGTDTDITELKRAEQALRQAEEINKRIVENTGDCVKILDLDGRFLYVNREGLRLLEIEDAGELLNHPIVEFLEGEARGAAEEAIAVARSGGTGRFQCLLRSASGVARWFDVVVTPITDAHGAVDQLLAVSRDITERRREEALRATHHQVLGMIATGSDLADVLNCLVRLVEQQSNGMRCSVLLLEDDGIHVRHGAAPSLPGDYVRAIDGMAIGPRSGSCGTAMFLGDRIVVTDILTDPLWEDYRDVAGRYGLRACWSTPFFSPQRKVLGSFAMYYDEPRTPSDEELRLIESGADVARIAVEHHRARQALGHSEARNRAILRAIPDMMFLQTVEGVYLDYHARDVSKLLAPPSTFLGKNFREVLPHPLGETMGKPSNVPARRTNPRRSNTRWKPMTPSASTRRVSSAATATRSSASSGISPIGSAQSSRPPRKDMSSRIWAGSRYSESSQVRWRTN